MGKRIAARRRGRGSIYRSPSHRHHGPVSYPRLESGEGTVIDIQHSPGHTAPMAIVRFQSGDWARLLAPEGLKLNQKIVIGSTAPIERGNILPLGSIPEGTLVYNIEALPGDGGRFIRAAGTYATVTGQGEKTIVQFPSGTLKAFDPRCRATIGTVAGGGRIEKPFGKAGKRFHAIRSKAKTFIKVRGVAMCPVFHPHGGGAHQHVGRPSTVKRGAWPGQKVGRFAPKHKHQ